MKSEEYVTKTTFDEAMVRMDGQFDRLAKAMLSGFDRMERILENKADKSELHNVSNMMHEMIKRQETQEQEQLVMKYQLDRLTTWIQELAQKLHHKLSF